MSVGPTELLMILAIGGVALAVLSGIVWLIWYLVTGRNPRR